MSTIVKDPPEVAAERPRRRRLGWVIAAVVLGLAAGGTAVVLGIRAVAEPPQAPPPVVLPVPTPTVQAVERERATAFQQALPDEVLAFAVSGQVEDVELADAGATEAYVLSYTDGAGGVTLRASQWPSPEEARAAMARLEAAAVPSPAALMGATELTGATGPAGGAPDAEVPAATSPDGSAADTGAPGAAVPDGSAADTAAPDAAVPDGGAADTGAPDAAVPETAVPETAVPETAVPETAAPDGSAPDVPAPVDAGPPVDVREEPVLVGGVEVGRLVISGRALEARAVWTNGATVLELRGPGAAIPSLYDAFPM